MATLKVTNIKNESFAGDQLYLKTDGKIGIGTTSPGHKLVISQTNSGGIAAIHLPVDESTILGPNANTYLKMGGNVVLGANGQLDLTTSGTSKLTIKNNGQVAIGSSSPDSSALFSIIKDTTEVLADNEPLYNNASPAFLTIYNSNNTGTGEEAGINLVPAGNANGAISIYGKKTGSYAGDLIFRFRSGASTSAERMRIKSDGDVEVGGNLKTNNLSGRNLIINGAFTIAQRGTSSTSDGIHTVDRFAMGYGGENEAPTQSQHALTSSDTGPWEKGFRYSYHIQNGNQTGGAGAADYIRIITRLEAQDLANSGWHYTSTSSYATLSFWLKSSVAQTFYGQVFSQDGSPQNFPFSTGALSANTWTKVEINIPGGSNVQFDNNNKQGMVIYLWAFGGTDMTGSPTLNTWAGYSGSNRIPDMTSTWWTTNDATFEITGVQLEVGSIATEYEHKPYIKDLVECQRYFRRDGGGDYTGYGLGVINNTAGGVMLMPLDPPMRAAPTVTNDGNVRIYDGSNNANVTAWNTNRSTVKNFWIEPSTGSTSFTVGRAFLVGNNNDTSGYLNLSAEL